MPHAPRSIILSSLGTKRCAVLDCASHFTSSIRKLEIGPRIEKSRTRAGQFNGTSRSEFRAGLGLAVLRRKAYPQQVNLLALTFRKSHDSVISTLTCNSA